MPPVIRELVSLAWYEGELKGYGTQRAEYDLEKVVQEAYRRLGWPSHCSSMPIVDVSGAEIESATLDGRQLHNKHEVNLLVEHVDYLLMCTSAH